MLRPSLPAFALAAALLAGSPAHAAAPTPTHGPVVAEVRPDSAIIWARAPGPGTLELRVHPNPGHKQKLMLRKVSASHDQTASWQLLGLAPGRTYMVEVTYEDPDGRRSDPVEATFRTAPLQIIPAEVRFAMSGDLGGQGRCRRVGGSDATSGYPIFSEIAALQPDFFIMNGDQIYADGTCPAEGPDPNELHAPWTNLPGPALSVSDERVNWTERPTVRQIFWEHWRYNRGERHYQELLRRTAFYAQWDDHEIINDQGASWSRWNPGSADRPGYETLVQVATSAWYDYNPVEAEVRGRGGLYRSFRWGRDVELFLVDARTWRSPNTAPDTAEAAKTLLGEAQRRWLVDSLVASEATWKIVSVDVPLAQPTGSRPEVNGHDGWANGSATPADQAEGSAERTGFERELLGILSELDKAHVRNVVFLATDVHFAQLSRFSLDLDSDGDPLVMHEVIAGPLSAGASPTVTPDPTLQPQVLYAEGNLFNFAYFISDRQSGQPTLTVEIRGENGQVRPGGRLVIEAIEDEGRLQTLKEELPSIKVVRDGEARDKP